MTKTKEVERTGGRIGAALRAATLGLSLLVAPAMGCGRAEQPKPAKQPAAAVVPASQKAPASQPAGEKNEYKEELSAWCSNGKSKTLSLGESITTPGGRVAKLLVVEDTGALFLAGEKGKGAAKEKYSVALYAQNGNAFAVLDPELVEGQEAQWAKKSSNSTPVLYVCPKRPGPGRLKIVTATYAEVETALAARKEFEARLAKAAELVKRKEDIEGRIRKAANGAEMERLMAEHGKVVKEMGKLGAPSSQPATGSGAKEGAVSEVDLKKLQEQLRQLQGKLKKIGRPQKRVEPIDTRPKDDEQSE